MSAKFTDMRFVENPENGTLLADGASARTFLKRNAATEPFIAELRSDQATLSIGLGPEIGCAQFTNADGEPPYLVANLESEKSREGFVDFKIGNEPSEIPLRLCIPLPLLLEVAAFFVETGKRSPLVSWEEI